MAIIKNGKGTIFQLPTIGNNCGFIKIEKLSPSPASRKFMAYWPRDKDNNVYNFKKDDEVEFDVEIMLLSVHETQSVEANKTYVAVNLKKHL